MKHFSKDELQRMRQAKASSMNDACIVSRLRHTEQDSYGETKPCYHDDPPVACGFRYLSSREASLPAYSKLEVIAVARIPTFIEVGRQDHIKILLQNGSPTDNEVFNLVGQPKRTRSGFILKLKRVTI